MPILSRSFSAIAALLAVAVAPPAQADLSIAKQPTKNVSCNGGSCVATARSAVMNVTELQNLLATQPSVSLDAATAKNIAIDAALSWTSSASFALSASGTLRVNKPVTVAGHSNVAIQTADFGLSFAPRASISFSDLSSGLTINNVAYTLVGDTQTIVDDLNNQVSKAFAFAKDHDAAADTFPYGSPIPKLGGADSHLEGLGHTISHLNIDDNTSMYGGGSGLIALLEGTLTNLHIAYGIAKGTYAVGLAVGVNSGVVDHVSVNGTVMFGLGGTELGGLVGENNGTIRNASAKVKILHGGIYYNGALAGTNSGTISTSWADGDVRGYHSGADIEGGLTGFNAGTIENSYSLANVHICDACSSNLVHGGLVGQTFLNEYWPSTVATSYAAGRTGKKNTTYAGGAVGYDQGTPYKSVYWVTDSGKRNPKWDAGNKAELPGVTGLAQAQLRSALPPGFDPKIWGQSPDINGGYPYLLSNPPE